jgi:nuclear receptor
MDIKAVQEERGPRKRKLTKTQKRKSKRNPEMKSTDKQKNHFEILVQILLTCLKEARQNQHFKQFSKDRQDFILNLVWSECFVLKLAHWSISVDDLLEKYSTVDSMISIFSYRFIVDATINIWSLW